MELLTAPDVVAGALLFVVAAAAGVNLYVTLGALGLASRLELIPALPPGLSGLENGLVIGTAFGLLLVEALADRENAFAGMWHSLHALVKPVAAALLTASALMGQPVGRSVAACLVAGCAALLFHAIRYGVRVAIRLPDAPVGSALVTFGEAALAAALLVPLRFPVSAVPTAAGLLLIGAIAGPLGVRACRLGVSAQRARLRAFLGETGWSGADRLPARLRARLQETPLAASPPRAARIGVLRVPGLGRYTLGWLVADAYGQRILARSWRGLREVPLDGVTGIEIRAGAWADEAEFGVAAEAGAATAAVRAGAGGAAEAERATGVPERAVGVVANGAAEAGDGAAGKLRILLLKDGPAPALVARSLMQEPVYGSRVSL